MVGDSITSDIAGAHSAGMKALHLAPTVLDSGPGQIRNLYEILMGLGLMDNAVWLQQQEALFAADYRARVQASALANLDLVNEQDAGHLLRLYLQEISEGLRVREERQELIRLQRGGAPFYLRAQFDAANT